jgi:hypothetical protein
MQENVLAVDLNACARQVLQARGPGADQKGPNQWRDSRLIMLPPCSCDVVHRHAPRLWQQREWQHGDARHPQKFPCTGGRRVRTSGRHKTKGAAHRGTHTRRSARTKSFTKLCRGDRGNRRKESLGALTDNDALCTCAGTRTAAPPVQAMLVVLWFHV